MDIVVKVSTFLRQLKKVMDIENTIRIKFGNFYNAKAVLLSRQSIAHFREFRKELLNFRI